MFKYQTFLSSGDYRHLSWDTKDNSMASLKTPLLAALVFLALILQATEAGKAGEREDSLQRPGSDTAVSSS